MFQVLQDSHQAESKRTRTFHAPSPFPPKFQSSYPPSSGDAIHVKNSKIQSEQTSKTPLPFFKRNQSRLPGLIY